MARNLLFLQENVTSAVENRRPIQVGARGPKARYGALVICIAALTLSFTSRDLEQSGEIGTRFAASRYLHKIAINLDENALRTLRIHPRKTVDAIMRMDETRLSARVHLKGNSSFQTIDQKPSFTISLADSAPSELPPDFKKFHLNNSVEDPTFLNELIGTELFHGAGVPAPDISHALVELNGRTLGLYVLKEAFSDEFLQRAFPGGTGRIYEPIRAGQLSNSDGSPLDLQRSAGRLDKDSFRSFVAMELLTVHRDGYTLAANNFRVYDDPATGRLRFLPTGMDQLFGKPNYPLNVHFRGELAETLFASASETQKLQERMRELLPLVAPTRLNPRIDTVLTELKPFLGRRQFNEMRAAADDLKGRIAARYAFLQQNLGTSAAQPSLVAATHSNMGK